MQDPNERRIIQEEVVQTPQGAHASVVEDRVRVMPTPAEQQLASLYRAKRIVWFVVSVIIAVIALRFVLLALAANQENAFASFVYGLSGIFVAPFLGLFGAEPTFGTSYYESASLVAIAVYLMLGWLISKLLELILAPKLPPVM